MEDQIILQILGLLETMKEACQDLYTSARLEDGLVIDRLCGDMTLGMRQILQIIKETDTAGNRMLIPACESILDSIRRVKGFFYSDRETCLRKIEFEVLPLIRQAYGTYYFFQYLANHPEELPEYHAKKKGLLFGNNYVDEALAKGQFKYEVSIGVLAYNKLDYTRVCVESLLANIPKDLHYELILINHGSNDGTKEYFESIHPDKQLDIAVNGGGFGAVHQIVEGEFYIGISNDVIVAPHAIENMLACIRSDPKIALVVPSTPNVSNFQSIPAPYSSSEELLKFARQNNRTDPFRWEQRVRLCDPIEIDRSVLFASDGICPSGAFHTSHPVYAGSFPDDKTSLLLRRRGYKMMLAKDAFCHHFGSVTLKDEIKKHNEQVYYSEGRREFQKAFGVDPWGTGFCFDSIFMERVVGDEQGHVEILGINCGLGSNALKIKEQIKEYCHNTDCCLSFLTDNAQFLADLRGIGDNVEKITFVKEFKQTLIGRKFQYIVWEDPFLPQYSFDMMLNCCRKSLAANGTLLLKLTAQNQKFIRGHMGAAKALGNNWYLFH